MVRRLRRHELDGELPAQGSSRQEVLQAQAELIAAKLELLEGREIAAAQKIERAEVILRRADQLDTIIAVPIWWSKSKLARQAGDLAAAQQAEAVAQSLLVPYADVRPEFTEMHALF